MTQISIGGFGFGKHYKTLEEAINNPATRDSDTLVIHKSKLQMQSAGVINKTLYIQGNGTAIFVKPGQMGLSVEAGDLHLSGVNFFVPPQSNAISIAPSYSGHIYLDHVNIEHLPGSLREAYPSLYCPGPQQGMASAAMEIKDSNIDLINANTAACAILHSTIGRLYRTQSQILALDFSASDVRLDNTYISAANKAPVLIDKLTTAGQMSLNGKFSIENTKIINTGIDAGSNRVTDSYRKASKLMNEYAGGKQDALVNCLFYVFGDKTYTSELKLNKLAFPQDKPMYKRQLLSTQKTDTTISNSNIPQLEVPSFLESSTITLDGVTDRSHWNLSHTTVSSRASKSTLLGGTKKVQSNGAKSVNGVLTDTDDLSDEPNALKELDDMIGMTNVKKQIHRLIRDAKAQSIRKKRGLATEPPRLNTAFLGAAGTGKTTVAEKLSSIFFAYGITKSNKFRLYKTTDLIGQYVGETQIKTRKAMMAALDGCCLIDECYNLYKGGNVHNSSDDFGQEAVNELMQDMENNPGRLTVFFAGYPSETMNFINNANPGLRSRVTHFLVFKSYTPKEMLQILAYMLSKAQFRLADIDTAKTLRNMYLIALRPGSDQLGNARFARNVKDSLISCAQARIGNLPMTKLSNMSDRQLSTITKADVEQALSEIINQNKELGSMK